MQCPACEKWCDTKTPGGSDPILCEHCGVDLSVLVQIDNLVGSYYQEGIALARVAENQSEAMGRFLAVLAMSPDHVDSHVVLGKVYAQRGFYDEAEHHWHRTLELVKENDPAYHKARKGLDRINQIRRLSTLQSPETKETKRPAWRTMVIGLFAILLATVSFTAGRWLPVASPNYLSAATQTRVSATLQDHPALRGVPIHVWIRSQSIVIEGEVPSKLHKFLVEAIVGQSVPQRFIDSTGLRVKSDLSLQETHSIVGEPASRLIGRDRIDTQGINVTEPFLTCIVKPE